MNKTLDFIVVICYLTIVILNIMMANYYLAFAFSNAFVWSANYYMAKYFK